MFSLRVTVKPRGLLVLLVLSCSLMSINCGGRTESPATSSNTAASNASTPAQKSMEGDGLPVSDASRFRDRLLELAKGAAFDKGARSSYASVEAIRGAWQKAYPGLQFTIFYSQAAKPDTVSVGDSFLTARLSGNYDQLLAFAVADTQGRCAGGVAVIPGESAEHKVSEEKVPSVFKAVEVPSGKTCSGEAVGDNYKP